MIYTGDPDAQTEGSTRGHSAGPLAPTQPQGVASDARQIGDTAILNCQTWLAENYERAGIVTGPARQSSLLTRAFERR